MALLREITRELRHPVGLRHPVERVGGSLSQSNLVLLWEIERVRGSLPRVASLHVSFRKRALRRFYFVVDILSRVIVCVWEREGVSFRRVAWLLCVRERVEGEVSLALLCCCVCERERVRKVSLECPLYCVCERKWVVVSVESLCYCVCVSERDA